MNRSLAYKFRLTLGAVVSVVMMAIGFQNCGQAGSMAQMDPRLDGELFKVSASQFRDLVMTDQANNRNLNLNLDSGTINSSDGNRYCLNQTSLQTIQELLSTSNVCEPAKRSTNPDIVCTMIYKQPYAQLRSASMELALGEARNGCDFGLDLCGEAAIKLRAFVSDVISGIDGMQCN